MPNICVIRVLGVNIDLQEPFSNEPEYISLVVADFKKDNRKIGG